MVVYVLKSVKDTKHYVGMSADSRKRLVQHNRGEVDSTKNRRPFELLYEEKVGSLHEARKREEYFKSAAGRRYLKKLGV